MTRLLLPAALVVLSGMSFAGADEPPKTQIWAVDPLVKVFPDSMPVAGEAVAEVARGEHASLQVVVRCPVQMTELKATVEPLVLEGMAGKTLAARSVRFVGYVPVEAGIPKPPRDRLRVPPAYFPDPLLEDAAVNVTPGCAQAIWITIPIPLQAEPGLYRGQLQLSAKADNKPATASLPLAVRVYPVQVDRTRLWVTNWFQTGRFPGKGEMKQGSEAYWDMLRRYARNMADHRQNVALISPLSLAEFKVGDDGELDIDFARFDKCVGIFTQEGVIGRIEGGHIGGRVQGWESQFVVNIRRIKDGKVEEASVAPVGPEADAFYSRFFPALVKHLKEKGWLDIYMQHLADEPIDMNIDTYRPMSDLVRKYAPELRVIEACHTKDLTGAIQVWVPQINFLHDDFAHYRQRQQAGDELWFYTCMFPQEEYANRFIEQPLIKTRLLHWINYRYGVTGYLHWGYNFWSDDAFRKLAVGVEGDALLLPAGDSWIVYPGKDGPLDSIRFEAMRDGIVDHELLSRLAERDPAAARRLVEKHVLDFNRYDADPAVFRASRHELLELLSKP
ncbi:MAG TPA: glycoside hydrolase domain-containing protein [Phycisphaerae bacterium]|nr:glycoside hydrolase domain-containing protein [Phycisphaerae bacterium]